MTRSRVWLSRALLALAAVAIFDVVLSLTWLRNGLVGKRPLPPFGIELDAPQLAVLARLESGDINPHTPTVFDRELGWCVRPNAVHPDGTFHINARGQRSVREYSDEPAPGKVRIACYGDSFTFGDEVQDDYTFETFLERKDPAVEALNYGVSAYGTDQALLRMRRDGIDHARVVVIGLLLENIGRNVNRYRPLWTPRTLQPMAKPRFIFEGGALQLLPQPFADSREFALAVRAGTVLDALAEHEYWRARPEVWSGKWSSIGRLAAGWIAYRERDPRKLWLDREGEPRRVTLALIEALQSQARALGAEHVLVLMLPMREELDVYRKSGQAYWSEALTDLAALHIACLDLAPALAAQDARCEQDPAHPTLYVSSHLSSEGNQVVALAIEQWLTQNHLLAPAAAGK